MRDRFTRRIWTLALAAVLSGVAAASANVPNKAQDLLLSGRIDETVSELQKRIAAGENDAEAYHLLSRTYYSLEKWDEAIRTGERAVQLAPGRSEYHLWLGRAYGMKAERAGIFSAARLAKEARKHFEKAVELNGNDPNARADLAEYYVEAPGFLGGGKDKARAQAEAAAKQDPPLAHWINARVAEKDKDIARAEREYQAAVKASNNDPIRWLNLASFYQRQGRYADMEAAISSAVGKPKKQPNVLVDAAGLLLQAGRSLPQAAQFVSRYLAGKEKSDEAPTFHAHYLLGQILEKQGDREGAIREYRAALQLAKDYGAAREALKRLQGGR